MKSSHQIEFTAGLFLLLGIAALVFLALHATDGGALKDGGYRVVADFSNVGGLKARANVSLGGVRVGSVESIDLDPETFSARVVMIIGDRFRTLPEDTSASILTSGILGDQYIGLEPGGAPDMLKDGDKIMITQSALVLEQLISRFLFNSGGEQKK
ncbi:MAG: outer membrane lipid asymmetry maintenance protein MlaD [Gammaproteobacteria bacterium]|jgi:phospholipid/cholesterol/gamma-HCH transport system substrate-binding protein|nr:outer membrane lipid asymmetry maintenance protein MlaD [Gammaproteobacteria bacterium]MBK8133784.1 outer membrane lipid asymmetry maintenance protein MlaD [Gammaproteobacteria bacterium]MBK9426599.1 outer membrane lipid asymmetry maintenance protein MlaD [Gammaproteobacteria bacterium]